MSFDKVLTPFWMSTMFVIDGMANSNAILAIWKVFLPVSIPVPRYSNRNLMFALQQPRHIP